MLWERITLTKEEIDADIVERIRGEFEELWSRYGRPEEAALFINLLPDQTGANAIYFTPAAAKIAEDIVDRHSGIPCNPPPRVSVKLLSGKMSAMDLMDEAA
jgi:hypothetical protein